MKFMAILLVFGFMFSGCGLIERIKSGSTDELAKTVRQDMIQTLHQKGINLKIKDFSLVHEEGNHYTGYLKGEADGEALETTVAVTSDGDKIIWKINDE